MLANWQCTPLNCGTGWFSLTYAYNLIGGMTSYTDGVGHTFAQSFDTAGRVTQLTSSLTGPQYPATLASNFSYNAAGAVEYMKFGNNLYHRVDMNNRLQPCRFRVTSAATAAVLCSVADPSGDVLQMKYSYNHGTANNGNVMSWAANGAQSFSRGYTYDGLNRLETMTWSQCNYEWGYDIWGNRLKQDAISGSGPCGEHFAQVNVKNQTVDTGYVYDAAGNMTQEPGKTYQYDAEGRLKSLNNGCAGSGPCYVYDANGRRVRKIASGVTTEYIYGAGGVVAEKVGTTWTVGYVYLNGQLLAQYKNGTTYFAHKDHLGSTRLLTKPDGSYDPADVYDFLPYGEPVGSQSTTTSHKFTGKERDTESSLDYFGARYYSSAFGRFSTEDPGPLREEDPQSVNRYAYARNNPVSNVDVGGYYWVNKVGPDTWHVIRETNSVIPSIEDKTSWVPGLKTAVTIGLTALSILEADNRKARGDTNRHQGIRDPFLGFTYDVDHSYGLDPVRYSIAEGIGLDERVFKAFSKVTGRLEQTNLTQTISWFVIRGNQEIQKFHDFHTAYRYAQEIRDLEKKLEESKDQKKRERLKGEISKRRQSREFQQYGALVNQYLDEEAQETEKKDKNKKQE